MTFSLAKLADIQYIPSSAGSLLANPSGEKRYITGIIIHNTNISAESVKLYNVPDSTGSLGTASASNQFAALSIPAGETIHLEYPRPGLTLSDQNDSIQGETTTSSKVTIQFIGAKDA